MFEPIDAVVADDRVEADVILGIRDVAGDVAGFLEVFWEDVLLTVREPEGAAVVDSLKVGAGDGEEDGADLHVAGVLGLGEGVFEAGAGLREIGEFAPAHACGFGDADPEDFYRAVGFYLADDDAGLAGADFKANVDFGAAGHGCQLRLRRDLRSSACW